MFIVLLFLLLVFLILILMIQLLILLILIFVTAADFNTATFANVTDFTNTVVAVVDGLTSPILHLQSLSFGDEKELLLLQQISVDNQISASIPR